MKKILVLLMVFIASCGGSSSEINAPQEFSDTPEVRESIIVMASRDYGDNSSWDNFELASPYTGYFEVPDEINLLEGSSGDGWFSLTFGNRKFCYQGNLYNDPNFSNGDKFLLISEIRDSSKECSSRDFKEEFDGDAFVEEGEIIKASVHGGGCQDFCSFTRIEKELIPLDEM